MVYVIAFVGGIVGLTWELLWMHHTALSLGISAQGAALTLIAFSIGMGLGSLAAGRWLQDRPGWAGALALWGWLEIVLGLLGQALEPGFATLSQIDAEIWQSSPQLAPALHMLGMLALLAAPAACMGATIPVFAEIAEKGRVSLARLYALNVAGAAVGILLASFVFIPGTGVYVTTALATCCDIAIGLVLLVLASRARQANRNEAPAALEQRVGPWPPRPAIALVMATGFATFALEVAWFRSLRAAFQATTESFALVLFATLLSLAAGGALAPRLRAQPQITLPRVAAAAAVAILLSTPIVERVDELALTMPRWNYATIVLGRLLLALLVLGPTMTLIGIVVPWSLELHASVKQVAVLYAANTVGSVLGSLLAAWVLLPSIGFAASAWIAAAVLLCASLAAVDAETSSSQRRSIALVAGAAMGVAWLGASEVGRLRIQSNAKVAHTVKATREGPDATVSVIEHAKGDRYLVIDGFYATGTGGGNAYMAWMGHLPMMMHPRPQNALVICFGTGQTSNAVLREGPQHLDVVDVSESVLDMHSWFPQNEGVLNDPRVEAHVMDGHAWLRRNKAVYDVITLEPMPPSFAGSNALYSRDFYELMTHRLSDGGIVAQWLPFHLVDPQEAASIAATFIDVFPNALMWVDDTGTGILLGRHGPPDVPLTWPGLERAVDRPLDARSIFDFVRVDGEGLRRYAELGVVITNDNQHLSYGWGRERWWGLGTGIKETILYQLALLDAMAQPGDSAAKLRRFQSDNAYPGSHSLAP